MTIGSKIKNFSNRDYISVSPSGRKRVTGIKVFKDKTKNGNDIIKS